jgi:predicted phosphodiesterase
VRLHVLSDLHLERSDALPAPPPARHADVHVLAGDIARGADGVRWAVDWAEGRRVLYLAGNHEFYGHGFPDLFGDLRAAARGTSVTILEDAETVIDGVRFLGCTLWSDFDFDGVGRREESMAICAAVVNDYRVVRYPPERRPLAPADTRAVHLISRSWLTDRLAAGHDGPTVVLTHHAPLIRGRPKRSLLRAVGGAFASDLSALMGGERAAIWVYGHTHRRADLNVDGTRVVSNPRGYTRELVPGFNPALLLEV